MREQTEDDAAGGSSSSAGRSVSQQGAEVRISITTVRETSLRSDGGCVRFRGLALKTGLCSVPSQPMLEWTCLKVLGAAELLSCSLQRCSRAFLYPGLHCGSADPGLAQESATSKMKQLTK